MIEGEPALQSAQFYPVDTWDRDWVYYLVKPTFTDEKADERWPTLSAAEVNAHQRDLIEGWSGHLYGMTTPITSYPLQRVLSNDAFRLYPPFELNRRAAVTGSLTDIEIPTGTEVAGAATSVPDYAVTGVKGDMHINGAVPNYGLRLDIRDGIDLHTTVLDVLELVRQFTFQWWINTARNPFDQGARLHFELKSDFSPRTLLKYNGFQGKNGPWGGEMGVQPLCGHELPLDESRWLMIGRCIERGIKADFGITLFNNAVEHYMAFKDREAILNLALQFEVCENRCLLMDGKADLKKNKDLLKVTKLVRGKDRDLFRWIITDRDNIAHGRPPYHASKDPGLIRSYLSAGRRLIDSYLEKLNEFGLENAGNLKI